ncbi:hypothetical protein [Nonomuraea sp. NPDC049400]
MLATLTPQEPRIAGLVADGLSSKQIAARLSSPRVRSSTVRKWRDQ